jgi:glycosyltransferase involved in cell wall biosynthesis
MEKPLVSVIMPVYNGEKYIGKAIESVLAQNVPTELLVIDDCSTDKTELTVMKYILLRPEIPLIFILIFSVRTVFLCKYGKNPRNFSRDF